LNNIKLEDLPYEFDDETLSPSPKRKTEKKIVVVPENLAKYLTVL